MSFNKCLKEVLFLLIYHEQKKINDVVFVVGQKIPPYFSQLISITNLIQHFWISKKLMFGFLDYWNDIYIYIYIYI
jgi:hypothetical protein